MSILDKVKRNLWILPPLLILIYIFAINYSPDTVIMGLDNASPYFSPLDIIKRVVDSNSFIYGGIIFISPLFWIIRTIGVSPSLLSFLYIYTCVSLGILGIILISKRFNKDKRFRYVSFLVSLTSLVTLWIISQPNFLFIAAYGSIPLIIYYLSSIIEKKNIFPLMLLTILFLITSLNLIAFSLFIVQIFIISLAISHDRKKTIIQSIVWTLVTVIFWITTLQTINIINGSQQTIFSSLGEYIHQVKENPYMEYISDDLISSESKNEIIDSMRFSTGWMEMHDINSIPIFRFYDEYKSTIFTIIGSIPFIFSLLSIYKKQENRRVILLTITLLATVFLTSKYTVQLIDNISLFRNSLRWLTSKIWPMYLIPISVLSEIGFSNLLQKKRVGIKIILTTITFLLIAVYGFPLFTGTAFSESTKVKIPDKYFELGDILEDNNITLYLPSPQKLYFRQYQWGYYGSDFLSYITDKNTVDSANLYEYPLLYEKLKEEVNNCNFSNVDLLIYDRTVENTSNSLPQTTQSCINEHMNLIESNMYFNVYEK